MAATAAGNDVEDLDVEIELPRFLNSVLEKAEGELWSSISLWSIRRRVCFAHSLQIDHGHS